MNRGDEALRVLALLIGRPVEPAVAAALIKRKVLEQEANIEYLSDWLCCLAWDMGRLQAMVDDLQHATQCLGVPCDCGLEHLEKFLREKQLWLKQNVAAAPNEKRLVVA